MTWWCSLVSRFLLSRSPRVFPLPLSDALSMLMDTAHSAIFQGMIEVQKKLFMAKQTGFELLRLVLTNGEGALSTVRMAMRIP